MNIDWKLVVEFVTAIAWPLVAAFALYLLRRPLIQLVSHIARRARKLSVFEVSVELSTLPELHTSWKAGTVDVRQLSVSQIIDSFGETLFKELLKPTQADYAIVDLGEGKKWLTSRLFVFALILGEVKGLRAFVFVEKAGGIRRRFLGTATPANVRRNLGGRYPWLEEAFARALAAQYGNKPSEEAAKSTFVKYISPFHDDDPTWSKVRNFVSTFIANLQRTTEPPIDEKKSYLDVDSLPSAAGPPTRERAHFIDGELLEHDLDGVLDCAWYEDSPDTPRSLRVEAILRRTGAFIALVDSDRRFQRLVDRYALLDQVSELKENKISNTDQAAS